MFVESFKRADECPGVLQNNSDSVIDVLQHLVVFTYCLKRKFFNVFQSNVHRANRYLLLKKYIANVDLTRKRNVATKCKKLKSYFLSFATS